MLEFGYVVSPLELGIGVLKDSLGCVLMNSLRYVVSISVLKLVQEENKW